MARSPPTPCRSVLVLLLAVCLYAHARSRPGKTRTGAPGTSTISLPETTYTYPCRRARREPPLRQRRARRACPTRPRGSLAPLSGACSACTSPIFVQSASPPGTACAALGALFCPARAPRGSTRDPRGGGGPSGPPWLPGGAPARVLAYSTGIRTCSAGASWPGARAHPSPAAPAHIPRTLVRAGAPHPR